MKKLIYLALPLFIVACGGGGDSSSSTTPSPTLNLNAAYVANIQTGSQTTSTISGYCSGTTVVTNSAAYSGKNGAGVTALKVNNNQVDTIPATNTTLCKQIYDSNDGGQTYINFYDATTSLPISDGYTPKYIVITSSQSFPTSVTSGASGTFYTYQDYKGGASPVTSGVVTYAVSADSASTLLVTLTDAQTVISSGAPYATVATVYRLNANNTVSQVSKKLQGNNAATGSGDLVINETVVR
jgi:hypothetical protein